jgi:hypothetical protein
MYQPEDLKNRYKGISNSSLGWFRLSPKYFRDKIDRKIEEPEQDYFELGTKLHYYLLEPQKFEELYVYLDFPIPSSAKQKEFCELFAKAIKGKRDVSESEKANEIYKSLYVSDKKSDSKITSEAMKIVMGNRQYIKYLQKADTYKDTINYTTRKLLDDARQSVLGHKKANEILLAKEPYSTTNIVTNKDYIEANEATIYWEHPTVNIYGEPAVCKSRIDRLIIDHTNKIVKLVDLKTSYNLKEFPNKFKLYKYNEQLTFYWMAIGYMFNKLYPDKKLSEYTKESYIVAIQTNPEKSNTLLPVECKVFRIEDHWLEEGYVSIEKTLQEMVWYFENDTWYYSREYVEGDGSEII